MEVEEYIKTTWESTNEYILAKFEIEAHGLAWPNLQE
jgi:hypothetical protein